MRLLDYYYYYPLLIVRNGYNLHLHSMMTINRAIIEAGIETIETVTDDHEDVMDHSAADNTETVHDLVINDSHSDEKKHF